MDAAIAAALTIAYLATTPTTRSETQSLVRGSVVSISVLEMSAEMKGQVVRLTPIDLKQGFKTALAELGYVVADENPDLTITLKIVSYDSGQYFGGAKTAKMTVKYEFLFGASKLIERWESACEYRAKLDFQDSDARNKTAVNGCLADLHIKLAQNIARYEAR